MKKRISISLITILLAALASVAHADDTSWEGTARTSPLLPATAAQEPSSPPMTPAELEKQQTTMSVLKKPPIPLMTPDKYVRVLFFPYADRNNVLHNFLYAFLKVEEGKWIIGDYLMEPARVGKGIITPIENPQTSSAGGQQTKSPKKGDQRGEGR